MRAFKLASPGIAEIQEVEVPTPAEGEALIRVEAAGLCHSDVHLLGVDESWPFFGTTLGHETAGIVEGVGPGVTEVSVGDRVLVRAIWSCGECRHCRTGRDNACSVAGTRTQFPTSPGIAVDGGMADYIKSDQRHLTLIGDLDAAAAAPLADAGMTPMHAVNSVRDLFDADAVVVLIGVGGLGQVAQQIIAASDPAPRVVAVDTDPAKREHVIALGAEAAYTPDEAREAILDLTDGVGVDAVIDFVGSSATIDLSRDIIGSEGAIRVIGLSGGELPVEATLAGTPLPWGVNVERSYGGTTDEVAQVVELARQGKVVINTTTYPLADAAKAMDDLANGRVSGRAVLIP